LRLDRGVTDMDFSAFPAEIIPALKCRPALLQLRRQPRLWEDTSDFTSIDYGDVIAVDDRFFLVIGYTREGRFGIDEQAKQWVPKVVDLKTDERLIVKLAFYENYQIKVGSYWVTCYRSPNKEARVLELVRENPGFMQGYSVLDKGNNLIRILTVISGKRLDRHINEFEVDDETYFENQLKDVVARFLKAVESVILLHEHGLKHGDIRRDHLFVDRHDGTYRWIDFDYDFYLPERPFALDLYGLGNVLLYIVGRKNYRPFDVREEPRWGQRTLDRLHTGDLSLVGGDRIFNLQKLFPYLPDSLNNILLHFSAGTRVMYDSAREFHDDLAEWLVKA